MGVSVKRSSQVDHDLYREVPEGLKSLKLQNDARRMLFNKLQYATPMHHGLLSL